MRFIVFLFFLLAVLSSAKAASPFYFGNDEAVNLTNTIKYDNGIISTASSVDPTSVAVSADTGSILMGTDGNLYVKKDDGLTTNWEALGPTTTTLPAADITNVPSGNLSATDQQSANNELQDDIDDRELLSNKATDFSTLNNTLYPTTQAVDNKIDADLIWGGITGTLSNQTDLQSALDGKEDDITATTSADYYRGDKTFQTLNSSAVGLGNVDNTSDADKPISDDTQDALDDITTYNAKYTGTAGQSVVDADTIVYTTQVYDPYSIYNNTTGVGTIPVTGKWRISAVAKTSTNVQSVGNFFSITIATSASSSARGPKDYCEDTTTRVYSASASSTFSMTAGDTFSVVFLETLGTATVGSSGVESYLTIEKVGE